MGKQFWLGVGCACAAATFIWQPRYHRELIVIAVAAVMIGVVRYLKNLLPPE